MSEETRAKIRFSKRGKGNGRDGYKHSEETKAKMRLAAEGRDVSHLNWTGKTHSAESKQKISDANKRRFERDGHPLLGYKFSEDSKQKMRLSHLGQMVSEDTKLKLSEAHKGSRHWNWKGGITSKKRLLRNSREWKEWRKSIFERDDYTCQECGVDGVYIEAHHIIPFRMDESKLFLKKNGITLCRPCHLKTLWKESSFAERYAHLVAAQGN